MKHGQNHIRIDKYADQLKPNCPKYNVVKKDIDNFVKFVFDTLNKHVYADDSQIFELVLSIIQTANIHISKVHLLKLTFNSIILSNIIICLMLVI